MQNLAAVSHSVCAHVGGWTQKCLARHPLEWCVCLTPRNTFLPYICYHTKVALGQTIWA